MDQYQSAAWGFGTPVLDDICFMDACLCIPCLLAIIAEMFTDEISCPGRGAALELLYKEYWKVKSGHERYLLKTGDEYMGVLNIILTTLVKYEISCDKKLFFKPWPVWLISLGVVPQTERSQVQFSARAPA